METPSFEKRKWKNPLWNKGKYNPMYGKHHTEETKNKVSTIHEGKHFSLNTEFKDGQKLFLGKQHREETKKNMSNRKKQLLSEGWRPWIVGKRHSEKAKRKMSIMRKEYFKNNPLAKDKLREARKRQQIPRYNTKPELKLKEIIERNHLPFKYTGNGSFWLEDINPDFVNVNGKKVAIEVFGRYWHSPLYRKIPYRGSYEGRREIAKRYGWKLVILWDYEIDNEKLVLSRIGDK